MLREITDCCDVCYPPRPPTQAIMLWEASMYAILPGHPPRQLCCGRPQCMPSSQATHPDHYVVGGLNVCQPPRPSTQAIMLWEASMYANLPGHPPKPLCCGRPQCMPSSQAIMRPQCIPPSQATHPGHYVVGGLNVHHPPRPLHCGQPQVSK